jgi:hypothetical protein
MNWIAQFFATFIGELTGLSSTTWAGLVIAALLGWLAIRLGIWMFRLFNRNGYKQQFKVTGSHPSAPDNEVWMHYKDREALEIRSGDAILLSWKADGRRPYETKLTVRDRMRSTGALREGNAIIVSEGIMGQLAEQLAIPVSENDPRIELPVKLRRGWWPGDHPDPSIKMGFLITVWVTLITTVVSVVIQIAIP